MAIVLDGTSGITSPGGDTSSTSYTTPIVKSASSLTLQTNGSTTAVTIDASQNVGVGNASPTTLLTVGSTTKRGLSTLIGNSTTVGSPRFTLDNSAATGGKNFGLYVGNTAAGSFNISNITDGLTVLDIDSSGRMTLPYQPAFAAYRGSLTLPTTTWTTIVYDNCTLNKGSCYSTSTGRFTAPVAGYYYFEAIGEGGGGAFHTMFHVNGGTPGGYGDSAQNWTSSNVSRQAMVVNMNAGDYIYVMHYINAATTMTSNRCHFHGFLLG